MIVFDFALADLFVYFVMFFFLAFWSYIIIYGIVYFFLANLFRRIKYAHY